MTYAEPQKRGKYDLAIFKENPKLAQLERMIADRNKDLNDLKLVNAESLEYQNSQKTKPNSKDDCQTQQNELIKLFNQNFNY